MSAQPDTGSVPQWDLADRMRKALRESGVSVAEMAAYLGVSRRSVGNWINGHVEPGTQTLRLWAMRCGPPVTYEWLRTGVTAGQPGSGIQCFSPRPVTIRLRRAA